MVFIYSKEPAENNKSMTIFEKFENFPVFLEKIFPVLQRDNVLLCTKFSLLNHRNNRKYQPYMNCKSDNYVVT